MFGTHVSCAGCVHLRVARSMNSLFHLYASEGWNAWFYWINGDRKRTGTEAPVQVVRERANHSMPHFNAVVSSCHLAWTDAAGNSVVISDAVHERIQATTPITDEDASGSIQLEVVYAEDNHIMYMHRSEYGIDRLACYTVYMM
jgi:hypothetical protein